MGVFFWNLKGVLIAVCFYFRHNIQTINRCIWKYDHGRWSTESHLSIDVCLCTIYTRHRLHIHQTRDGSWWCKRGIFVFFSSNFLTPVHGQTQLLEIKICLWFRNKFSSSDYFLNCNRQWNISNCLNQSRIGFPRNFQY